MKSQVIILILFFCFSSDLHSQTYNPEWISRFNAGESSFDIAQCMITDSKGNVYITGKSWGNGSDYDYSTVKYNSSGIFKWESRYNGSGNYCDIPNSIEIDINGNAIVTGKSFGSGSDYDIVTVKYDSNGNQLWADRYNGSGNFPDEGLSVALDSAGNIFINGTSDEINGLYPHYSSCTTIKYNSNGVQIWVNKYFGQNGFYGKCIKSDKKGDVYVAGGFGGYNASVIKYNSDGVMIWNYTNSNNSGNAVSIEIDNKNNIFLLKENMIEKLGRDGSIKWIKFYDGTGAGMKIDLDGNVYLGRTVLISDISRQDIATTKYDSNGVLQWNSVYNGGGNLYDFASCLTLDPFGNVYSAGYSFHIGYPFNKDFVIVKYNSSGIKQWISKYAGTYGFEDIPVSISNDAKGNIYVTGYSYGNGTDFDYLTIKYPAGIQLNATVIMEGFYDLNHNKLNSKDTITAFLRNTLFPYSIVDSAKSIIDSLNFLCSFCFDRANSGMYYLAVKHRNSVETWSKPGGEIFNKSTPVFYNFTTEISQSYGNNMKQAGEKYCIYSGNVNQDFIIDASDISEIENAVSNSVSGYAASDLNGDGFVDSSDLSIVENNLGVGVVSP